MYLHKFNVLNLNKLIRNISLNKGFHSTIIDKATTLVNGYKLNYETAGSGSTVALCLPGALGTIESDFAPQMKDLAGEQIKLVAWDPPGYGKSRPPSRKFSLNFFHEDAACAAKLMENLGHEKYSLLGWSDGGITALILAAHYPKNVEKLVVWGTNAYITDEDVKAYEAVRDIEKWSDRMRGPMEKTYGKENFKITWEGWVDAMMAIYNEKSGNLCKEELSKIDCPTLIIHGAKDAMVPQYHPQYLHQNIKGSRLEIWEDGKHNLHLKYKDDFNTLVKTFINTNVD